MLVKLWTLFLILQLVKSEFKINHPTLGGLASIAVNGTLLGAILNGRDSINETCSQSLEYFMNGIEQGTDWAISMFDFSGKLPSRLNLGPTVFSGSYDQCINLEIIDVKPSFVGQYCKVNLIPVDNQSKKNGDFNLIDSIYRWDICIPSNCDENDITDALYSVGIFDLGIRPSVECELKGSITVDATQIVAITVFSLLGLFVLCGTVLDVVQINKCSSVTTIQRGSFEKALISFSLYTNSLKVLNVSSNEGSLTALGGIRFLSTTWIIMYHFYYNFTFVTENPKETTAKRFDFAYQVVLNSLVSVDTFFFLSGLLVAYVNLRKLQKNSINWFEFYIHRYWRLTPPVAFVILFAFIWPLLGSGPNWAQHVQPDVKACYTNWWTPLVYVNDFFGLENPCFDHLWYLANDMQFYIISPVIFVALHKWSKVGLAINTAFLAMSITVAAILGTLYDLQPTTLFFVNKETMIDSFNKIYTKPYCRMGPYCIGIFVGYLLVNKKNITIKPAVQLIGWSVAFICCISSLYGVYNWNRGYYGNLYSNSFYLATHRTVWSVGIAWLTFACATGYGGIINTILSSKVFIPLSRLTYIAYLIHPMIIKGFVGYQKDTIVVNQFLWVTVYLGLICISFGFAFVATLCIEIPFLNLEKVRLQRPPKTENRQDESSSISVSDKEGGVATVQCYSSMGTENGAFTMER